MCDGLVKLRERGNYFLWKGCLQRFPGLTKQQKSMLFHAPTDLATGEEGHAKQYKDIYHVYSILIGSLDDRVCSGLSAHGKLRHGQKPWELYYILHSRTGDGYSMALTCILYDLVEESIYEDCDQVHPVTKAIDWAELLEQVRELTHYKKRSAGDSLLSLDQGSGRVKKAIEADTGDNDDEVGI
ncbi:hypothetical protein LY76DRAFT_604347 [Colletotrichum caudatum]|nr:hypothetical protein LY76DRAFT_604347 [Colletotrichum caudatum]